MSEAETILTRARSLGLTVCVEGDRIAIAPARLCPPDLLAEFREYKTAVIASLEADTNRLPRDCAPWLHISRQVLAGEFDGCDRSTRASLTIGLISIAHSLCRRAVEHLNTQSIRQ